MNKTNETLIVLSPGFPKDEMDTTCLPSQQLFIKSINQIFPSLHVIILSFQYPFCKSVYQWNNNKVIAFGGKSRGKVHRLLLWFRVWKKLLQLKREHHIVGLFSFWCGECALMGQWFESIYNIKHFIWISGQDAKKENKYVRWIRPAPDRLVAMSDFLADEFLKNHLILPAHVVPIGIDPEMCTVDQKERIIEIIGAGSLIPLKQYDIFVEVIRILSVQFPSIKAVICGRGPEEQKVKKLIEKYHLENNISLIGEIPHAEVCRQMQRAKVMLHPSSYEGFGAVCIEALYAGAHVISFCRPMKQPISHWHVVSTEKEMSDKAIDILQNPEISHKPVQTYFMIDSAKKIMALFEDQ